MRDGADTRTRIERAALGLFADKGVSATTIRDIAQAAGVAEGALYRHHAGKDDLVWHLFSTHYTALAGVLDRLQQGEATGAGKLAAMIDGCCRDFDADPVLFTFLLLAQHGQLAKLTPDMPSPVDVFRDVIAAGAAAGAFAAPDPELATALVLGLILQPATFVAYGRLRPPLAARAPDLVRAALAILVP